MLILSRKKGESIVIDDQIEIVVVDIRGDQIKLGVNAPKTLKVYRKEVYDAIQKENREAALGATPDLSALDDILGGFEKK